MHKLFLQIFVSIIFYCVSFISQAQGTASQLFKQLKQQVYQIRVIDLASGDKSSIGSGFQISKDGYLATNFHVVSSYVHEPKKFRLEYVDHEGSTGSIELLDIDIIHDLAIAKILPAQNKYFKFNLNPLSKGDRIYSMGNPHDLSMLIIEGNYSGLIKESRYKKILFSGSLNSGMSGGPAFDHNGQLVGVNVAKGSEQLSFLVPVHELNTLFNRVKRNGKSNNLQETIEIALLNDQQQFYGKLLSSNWASEVLGDVTVSGKLDESLKCWGHTFDKKDIYYKSAHKHCLSEDRIYINKNMHSGSFSFDYEWTTTNQLNRFQFYSQIEQRYNHTSLNNISKKEDAINYDCKSDFIKISDHSWKISTCTRSYKKYSDLHDVLLLLASVDSNNKSLLAKVRMSGVSKENSMKFINKFLGEIEWKN